MEQSIYLKALAQQRRVYQRLSEVLDLSRQMAEAADREDPVTVQMFLSMRGEPIQDLSVIKSALQQQREEAAGTEDGARLAAILDGQDGGSSREEQALAAQVAANRRLYQQVMELDKRLNLKLTRDKSIYK